MGASLVCLLFPAPCRLCRQPLRHARRLPVCDDCLDAVPPVTSPSCRQCGQRWPAGMSATSNPASDHRCLNCQASPPAYDAALSASVYEGSARELIHLLKFHGVVPVAEFWAARLQPLVAQLPAVPELIVAVPLGRRRQRERGFNQSGEIARRLAHRLDCGFAPKAMSRRRDTQPQSGLTSAEREHNLRAAFVADPARVRGRSVLLVDDVLTTGATVRAVAEALRAAGARQVMVLTAARAELQNEPLAKERAA